MRGEQLGLSYEEVMLCPAVAPLFTPRFYWLSNAGPGSGMRYNLDAFKKWVVGCGLWANHRGKAPTTIRKKKQAQKPGRYFPSSPPPPAGDGACGVNGRDVTYGHSQRL